MAVNNLVGKNIMSPVKNIFQLIKSSGEKVVFDENKLKISIVAALRSAGIEDNPISNQLVDEVIKKLGEELDYRENITTLDVREAVEIAFLERGLTQAAQKYHDYNKSDSDNELQLFSQNEKQPQTPANNKAGEKKASEADNSPVLNKNIKEKKLSVEDEIEPPELDDGIKPSKETRTSQEYNNEADSRAFVHKFEIGSSKGFFLVILSDNGQPAELAVSFYVDNFSAQDKVLINLFARLVSIAWQNGVSLVDLFKDQEQLQFNFSPSGNSGSEGGALPVVNYLINWLSKKFI